MGNSSSRRYDLSATKGFSPARTPGPGTRPSTVTRGDGDRTCPCAARDVRRLVPRADVVVVRGARHCVYTEFVGESARAVVDHLRRAVA